MHSAGDAEGEAAAWLPASLCACLCGGVIAYTPFLMLMLPVRVTDLAGPEDISWLGYIVFAGAVAASASGIVFGWLSDRTQTRRVWIAAGLATTISLQLAMIRCDTIVALLWLVVAWQITLNMMLVPLIAWAGDLVPDTQKGLLGGLLSIAPALGAWSGIILCSRRCLLVWRQGHGHHRADDGVCFAAAALQGRPAGLPSKDAALRNRPSRPRLASAAVRMWVARLLLQISGAALGSYLYFWLRALDPAMGDGQKTALFAGGLTVSIITAFLVGRRTDRHGCPFCGAFNIGGRIGAGLVAMALAVTPAAAKLAYLLFATAGATFLALHASQMLRVLPDPGGADVTSEFSTLPTPRPRWSCPGLPFRSCPASVSTRFS